MYSTGSHDGSAQVFYFTRARRYEPLPRRTVVARKVLSISSSGSSSSPMSAGLNVSSHICDGNGSFAALFINSTSNLLRNLHGIFSSTFNVPGAVVTTYLAWSYANCFDSLAVLTFYRLSQTLSSTLKVFGFLRE